MLPVSPLQSLSLYLLSTNSESCTSMFSSLNSAVITGGTFSQYTLTGQSQNSYERLREATAPNAFHNSGERRDPPKCHHNTRVAILEKILLWTLNVASDSQSQSTSTANTNTNTNTNKPIMWVYGPAGAGKSAIAQSISDVCHDDQLLLASFFFSRFDGSRNHARSLVPTLVYQMAEWFPGETRRLIVDQIERDPLIFTRSLESQVVSLVVNPLKPLVEDGYFDDPRKCRRVVVIDGLDECHEREDQLDVLRAIRNALVRHAVPLIFFIASRPEHDLVAAFRSEPLSGISTMLPLDDAYQSHRDIELFLRDKFVELKTSHPFKSRIPPLWPGEDVIQRLVLKSSGQFIYAATVVKYIQSTRHRPPDRLDVVLGLQPRTRNRDMPFSELDALYTHIFSSLEDPEPVFQILAFYTLSATRYVDHVGHMEDILSIHRGDTEIVLCDLGSVVRVVEQPDTGDRILHIFHASLEDFLLDKSRSGTFWIDAPKWHAEFARLYIRYFKDTQTSGSDADTSYFIGGLFDLGSHIRKASPTPVLRDDIVSFSKSVLSQGTSRRKTEPVTESQQRTNDLLDFLKAIKESQFEDAVELEASLRLELEVFVEERTYEQSVLAPYSFMPFPYSDSTHPFG